MKQIIKSIYLTAVALSFAFIIKLIPESGELSQILFWGVFVLTGTLFHVKFKTNPMGIFGQKKRVFAISFLLSFLSFLFLSRFIYLAEIFQKHTFADFFTGMFFVINSPVLAVYLWLKDSPHINPPNDFDIEKLSKIGLPERRIITKIVEISSRYEEWTEIVVPISDEFKKEDVIFLFQAGLLSKKKGKMGPYVVNENFIRLLKFYK